MSKILHMAVAILIIWNSLIEVCLEVDAYAGIDERE